MMTRSGSLEVHHVREWYDRPYGLGLVQRSLWLPSMQEHVVARMKSGLCGCHARWLWHPDVNTDYHCSICGLKVRWVDADRKE